MGITTCTFYGNTSSSSTVGGAIHHQSGTTSVLNTLVYGNSCRITKEAATAITVAHSTVQGGYTGTGNNGSDPLFTATSDADGADNRWMTSDGGLALKVCPPAINATATTTGTDITGSALVATYRDMGAYEYTRTVMIPTTTSANFAVTTECADASNWTHYFHETAGNATLLLSVRKNGYAFGTVGDGTFNAQILKTAHYGSGQTPHVVPTTAPYVNCADWHVVNRWWNVTPNPQLPVGNTGAKVRAYYTSQGLADLNGSLGASLSPTDLRFCKINGSYAGDPDHDGSLATNDGHASIPKAADCDDDGYREYAYSTSATTCDDGTGFGTWSAGTAWGIMYAELEVRAFSGGRAGASSSAGALPVTFVSVQATWQQETQAAITWHTAGEHNVATYTVESLTGNEWREIGNLAADGSDRYSFTDRCPFIDEELYHRVRAIDFDGHETISNAVELSRIGNPHYTLEVFPNPTEQEVNVVLSANWPAETALVLMDAPGRVVAGKTGADIRQVHIWSLEEFPVGIYFLHISDGAEHPPTVKIVKQ